MFECVCRVAESEAWVAWACVRASAYGPWIEHCYYLGPTGCITTWMTIIDPSSGVCTCRVGGWGMNADSRLEPPRMCTHLHSRVPTSIRGWEQHDVLSKEVLCVCYVGWLGRAITCQYLCTLRLNGIMPFWLKGQRWGEEISLPLELASYDLSFLEQDHSRHRLGLKGEGTFGTSDGACPLP